MTPLPPFTAKLATMKRLESALRLLDFAELDLRPAMREVLAGMGVATPTPVQSAALPVGLVGQDLIAIAPAGTGKTLAYALSILTHFTKSPEARALVLVPSREVATQIIGVFERLSADAPFRSVLLIGGVRDNNHNNQMKKMPRLIVATPGRLNDLLRGNKLLLQGVSTLVIDEADRMLDLGFGLQLKEIQATMRGTRQTMLFSATFGRNVEALAESFMREEAVVLHAGDVAAPAAELKQKVFFIPSSMKNDLLIEEIKDLKGTVMVFTGSRESCEALGEHLRQNALSVDLVHGELSQGHRSRVVRDFRDGKFRVLVCTDLLARGFDVPDVELVVNFELPFKYEDVLHRLGRTARAGRSGKAITFITPKDDDAYEKLRPYFKGAQEIRKR
jgi:ATP-dependent RNA helicase RhlE